MPAGIASLVAGLIAVASLVAGLAPSAIAAPSLGTTCGIFPRPGGDVATDAPSLPDQRAWNQDISGAPVAADSDAIIGYVGGEGIHPDFGSGRAYGIPYAVVGARAKRTRVRFTAYGDESDRGAYRVPLGAPVEGGARGDGDRHVIAYDRARCRLYELFRAFPRPRAKRWDADSGVIWDLRSARLRTAGFTSADAAGLPVFAGLVRYDEVRARSLDHAIRVTFASTRDAWINPASHCAGDTRNPAAPPMGLRLRLKAAHDISGISGGARVIAEALKRYGMIVADNGSDWFFQGSPDPRWDDEDLDQLKAIPGSAFEVVRSQAEVHACRA